jgi:hypothetical protein
LGPSTCKSKHCTPEPYLQSLTYSFVILLGLLTLTALTCNSLD